jgi:hypothetical protein
VGGVISCFGPMGFFLVVMGRTGYAEVGGGFCVFGAFGLRTGGETGDVVLDDWSCHGASGVLQSCGVWTDA